MLQLQVSQNELLKSYYTLFMKKNFYLLISLLVIACQGKNSLENSKINDSNPNSISSTSEPDTILILNDSTKSGDYFIVLNYKIGNKITEIYRERDNDREMDLSFDYNFKNKRLNYKAYQIYDEPTGTKWSLLFDNYDGALYKTDQYDDKAIGDQIIKESVDFKGQSVKIKSEIDKREYSIKLSLIKKLHTK